MTNTGEEALKRDVAKAVMTGFHLIRTHDEEMPIDWCAGPEAGTKVGPVNDISAFVDHIAGALAARSAPVPADADLAREIETAYAAWADDPGDKRHLGDIIVALLAARRSAPVGTTAEAEIRELHQPKKVWESDRSYTLVCSQCELKAYPCPTVAALETVSVPHPEPEQNEGAG